MNKHYTPEIIDKTIETYNLSSPSSALGPRPMSALKKSGWSGSIARTINNSAANGSSARGMKSSVKIIL